MPQRYLETGHQVEATHRRHLRRSLPTDPRVRLGLRISSVYDLVKFGNEHGSFNFIMGDESARVGRERNTRRVMNMHTVTLGCDSSALHSTKVRSW